ncbi:putative reverse transcriptase zinc-binding domain-containing protein [Helianthus annuus]|nr:putative reverse transcriptase zinc-binding domain-containing protein [Helianthus annuus]
MCWVAWDDVMAPKDLGGVGIHAPRDTNIAMLAKWWWRFKKDQNGLWRKVVWGFHNSSRAWNFVPLKLSVPGIWKQVAKLQHELTTININLSDLFRGVPGDGLGLSFWHDCWLLEAPLKEKFPALFALECSKNVCIADRVRVENGATILSFQWRRQFSSVVEFKESGEITTLLNSVSLSSDPDCWSWKLEDTGAFSVKSLRRLMQETRYSGRSQRFLWNSWSPIKVNFLLWRVILDKLPTLMALRNRNVNVPNTLCPICRNGDESIDHLFISCSFAQRIWEEVSKWVRVNSIFLLERTDFDAISSACQWLG